ncbi:glucan biosynthesis protein [Wenzhouxiangella limi]|uniref:Glucan biosynthesis protein n=1 Tax=Wenzhouxiangella limi TaxID=2707351 RepID=A0A845V2Z6_9GAMM|nr:glucan biosynthesis protein G [Wenzhouxiangella limi]NDY95606.1 glucan biosynthesis protein [Wenzhouxiangella limi]
MTYAVSTQALERSDVADKAQALAARDWQPPDPPAPALAALDYDQYRAIRFDPDRALWPQNEGFRVQFFHPGFLFNETVRIHEIDEGAVDDVPFDPKRFRFDRPLEGPPVASAAGYAGFRVHYPLNRPERHDEFLVFLGASYFRLIGSGQVYGLSARGLALNSGGSGAEEFPVFREFWLQRPEPGQERLRLLALLDSPSVTGAFAFEVEPGDPTSMVVDAQFFARRDLVRPGIAALTSMFKHGDTGPVLVDDFRPRVHDSDGLLVRSSRGEAQWRPLSNRARVRLSGFEDDAAPEGFGLLQRRRQFEDFQDLEARYDLRPGLWVEPLAGDWGAGRVELVEIPTEDETFDNIVAFWVPDAPILAGESRRYRYRLTTVDGFKSNEGLAQVRATHTGRAGIPGQENWRDRSRRRFVIEFDGPALADAEGVELSARTRGGRLLETRLEHLPETRAIRAVVALDPDEEGGPSDLRVFLHVDERPVSEVWSYVWYPDEIDRQL